MRTTHSRPARALRLAGAALLMLTTAACASRVDTRGNLPDADTLASLKPGEYSRQEVLEMLGSPSTTAAFDGEAWYYVSKRTETFAFFAPETQERKVVIVRFDDEGILKDIETLGLADGYAVDLVERETPTAGNEITFLQQMFGNIGRFNKDKEGKK